MAGYLKTRNQVWAAAGVIGGVFVGVASAFYSAEISAYFEVSWVAKVKFLFLLGAAALPIFVSYVLVYLFNQRLISFKGELELRDRERRLLTELVDAHICQRCVLYHPDDLLDEYAWSEIESYWRNA